MKTSDLTAWNAIIGRIVHDYMNIDMPRVLELGKNEQYRFVTDFLLEPIDACYKGVCRERMQN